MGTIKKTFPENLRKIRKDRRLSREQLAEAIGVDYQTVGFWERGERLPQYNHFGRIAQALDISETELFFDPKIISKEKALLVLAKSEGIQIQSVDPLGISESLKNSIKTLSKQAYEDIHHLLTQLKPTSDEWGHVKEHVFLRRRGRKVLRRKKKKTTNSKKPPSSRKRNGKKSPS